MVLLLLIEIVVLLALAVVLSGYERRCMSLLHNRDGPVVYLILGLGQPIVDGGKLLMKSMLWSITVAITVPVVLLLRTTS